MGVVKAVVLTQGFLLLLLVQLLLLPPVASAADVTQTRLDDGDPEIDRTIITDLIEKRLREYLSQYEGLHIPELPTLDIENSDIISIALSLNDLTLTGVSNVNVLNFTHEGNSHNGSQTLSMVLPQISLTVGAYISAGHINNLLFNGEGPMSLTLYDLSLILTYDWDKHTITYLQSCVKDNTTNFDLNLRRMQVHFENLNAGTDQGQLIDIVFSSFGPDIVEHLENLLNNSWYDVLDDAIVNLINNATKCPELEETPPIEEAISNFALVVEDLLTSFFDIKKAYSVE
nr:uncharacterized protein LOC123744994 [Procambarus clarkii]